MADDQGSYGNSVAGLELNGPAWVQAQTMMGLGVAGPLGAGINTIFRWLSQMAPVMGGVYTPQSQMAQIMQPAAISRLLWSPDNPIFGSFVNQQIGRAMVGVSAAGAFQSVQGAGGFGWGRQGLGMGDVMQMQNIAMGMVQPGTSLADISDIITMAGQGGFTRGITDVRQARQRMQELVRTVVEMSRELSMTIQDVSQGLNVVRGMGFTDLRQASAQLRNIIGTIGATGVSDQQLVSMMQGGAALGLRAGLPAAAGAEGMRVGIQMLGAGAHMGFVSDQALINAVGRGGPAGAADLAGWFAQTSAANMNRSMSRYLMAAFLDPSTLAGGTLRLDPNRIRGLGAMSLDDIQRMAHANLAQMGGDQLLRWRASQPQLQGDLLANDPLALLRVAETVTRSQAESRGIARGSDEYSFLTAMNFARITGMPTRGPEFQQLQQMVTAALPSLMNPQLQEQVLLNQRRANEQAQQNAAAADRLQYGSINEMIRKKIGEYENRVNESLSRGIESISRMGSSLLGAAAMGEVRVSDLAGTSEAVRRLEALGASRTRGGRLLTEEDLARARSGIEEELAAREAELARTPGLDVATRTQLQRRIGELRESMRSSGAAGWIDTQEVWGSREARSRSAEETARLRNINQDLLESIRRDHQGARSTWETIMTSFELIRGRPEMLAGVAAAGDMSVETLQGGLRGKTILDVLVGMDPKKAQKMVRAITMGAQAVSGAPVETWAQGATVIGEETPEALAALRALGVGKGTTLGEAITMMSGRAPGESPVADVVSMVTRKFGAQGGALLSRLWEPGTLGQDISAQITRENLSQTKTLGEWLKLAVRGDKSKLDDLRSSLDPIWNQKLTGEELRDITHGAMLAPMETEARYLREAGTISDEATRVYERYRKDPRSSAGRAAINFLEARAYLERGDVEKAKSLASREALRLASDPRKLRGARGMFEEMGELGVLQYEKLMNLSQILADKKISAEEVAASPELLGDLSSILGRDLKVSDLKNREIQRALSSPDLQRRLQEAAALRSITPGVTKADSGAKEGTTFRDQIKSAFTDALNEAGSGSGIKVQVTNLPPGGGITATPSGGEVEEAPKSGGSGG